MAPLKASWSKIYPPLVEHLKIDVRMNIKTKAVELRTSNRTEDPGALQKAADFIKVFTLGFDIDDAIALLRLDELYTETFEIKDVKTLQGEHLSRAIGRIAGKDGKTKFAIENATKTRVVLADSKIHILGAFQNIRMARESIVSLILGAPPVSPVPIDLAILRMLKHSTGQGIWFVTDCCCEAEGKVLSMILFMRSLEIT